MTLKLLPLFLIVYGSLCFGVRPLLHWKKTGTIGIVLGKNDDAHGFIGKAFGLILLLTCAYIAAISADPDFISSFAPVLMQNKYVEISGLILISLATALCFAAQMNMKDSWRVGIDFAAAGSLVTAGLFRFSRNPIFLTMLMVQLGLLMVLPNWISFFLFTVSYLLIQIQVRLEEDFLKDHYGTDYLSYSKRVRRWI
jgi:protein-S-isoprenylcysteine O-methyltransferase Ste14